MRGNGLAGLRANLVRAAPPIMTKCPSAVLLSTISQRAEMPRRAFWAEAGTPRLAT
jgi:hypothetical protein